MSHYLDFESLVTDGEALCRAICRTPLPNNRTDITFSEAPISMEGYAGNRSQLANIIIPKRLTGGYGDTGFIKTKEGTYKAILDESDMRRGFDQGWMDRLYTYYNVEKAKMEFDSMKVDYTESLDDLGRIQLRAKFKDTTASKIQVRR
jgi:hypothetical protein